MNKIIEKLSNLKNQKITSANYANKIKLLDTDLFKNSFNRILLEKKVIQFISKMDSFFNGETLSKFDLIFLLKECNYFRNYHLSLFSPTHQNTINQYLDNNLIAHDIINDKLSQLFSSLNKQDDKSLSVYFLIHNIRQEKRYRNSLRVFAKYAIPHLNRAYSKT
jgi:hypothetical protein